MKMRRFNRPQTLNLKRGRFSFSHILFVFTQEMTFVCVSSQEVMVCVLSQEVKYYYIVVVFLNCRHMLCRQKHHKHVVNVGKTQQKVELNRRIKTGEI